MADPDYAGTPLPMRHQVLALLAFMLVTFVLGSVHAFSIFIVPLENLLNASRTEVSLFYSFTLVFITLTVLGGYRIYALASPPAVIAITCLSAATGLWIASSMSGWWIVFLGYSLLFGSANGIGYGYTLQLSGRVMPTRKGLAMGAVTAAYAVGSIVFSLVLSRLTEHYSASQAFRSLALLLILIGLVSAGFVHIAGARYKNTEEAAHEVINVDSRRVLFFWLCYFLSVFAGLMAIGHAAGIVYSRGAGMEIAVMGAMVVGIGSAVGGFLIGWLLDKWPLKGFLIGLPLLSTLGLVSLIWIQHLGLLLMAMSIVGFGYGSIIAVYPFAVSRAFGDQSGPEIYGRVFTAWGLAGLTAPWLAGVIFDASGNYHWAMVVAALTAFSSALAVQFTRIADRRCNPEPNILPTRNLS